MYPYSILSVSLFNFISIFTQFYFYPYSILSLSLLNFICILIQFYLYPYSILLVSDAEIFLTANAATKLAMTVAANISTG